ncbi:MAG: hypothetical protein ABH819_00700 [Patescibacteria group bacterium]
MGVYIKRSCPKCHFVLEGYTRNYIAIAKPFVVCPKCNTFVIFSNCNEWDLMGVLGKAKHVATAMYTGIIYAMIPIFLTLIFEIEISEYLLIFTSLTLGEIFVFYQFNKRIQESKRRMESTKYKETLNELGLIKNK